MSSFHPESFGLHMGDSKVIRTSYMFDINRYSTAFINTKISPTGEIIGNITHCITCHRRTEDMAI